MPLPNPKKNEKEQEYMSRCMTFLADEDRPNEQKVAMCLSTFRNKDKAEGSEESLLEKADFAHCCQKHLEDIELGFEEELTEANLYIPEDSEYEDFGEKTEEVSVASLWENIRKKKERMGKKYKPAKPGDKDRPDPEAWKKAQSGSDMAKEQIKKMHDQLMMIVQKMQMMDIELEEWTADMVSKAEIYIQNIFDFVSYYKPEAEEEDETEESYSAEYQGRKVTLNKPFRTPKGPKKFAVYTKNESGNVVIVRFGDKNMSIKRDDPERRKSFRARHKCDTNPGPKWRAKFWSCRQWRSNTPVQD
jgi:hypothetical protein